MATAEEDEQILPNSLQKLEIVPIGALNNSLLNDKNPFYAIPLVDVDAINDDGSSENCNRTVKLFGPRCSKCGIRVVGKDNALTIRQIARNTNNSVEHSIQRPISFKQRNKDKCQQNIEKNLQILREPILKSIGRSLHHHEHEPLAQQQQGAHNSHSETACNLDNNDQIINDVNGSNLVNNNSNGSVTDPNNVPTTISTQQTTNSEIVSNKKNWKLKKDATIDFKSLVTDCSHLTLSSTSSIGGSLQLHRTKQFQTLQENADRSLCPSTSTGGVTGPDTNTMNVSTSSNSSSASSTCSQQARMNTSNCDVTIDELASYFETFVHIPKKMSSMAEMMYI